MMIKKIKNVSGSSKVWAGLEIQDGSTYTVDAQYEAVQFSEDPEFLLDIDNNNVEVYNDTIEIIGKENIVAFLIDQYLPSLAVDLNNVDFSVTTDDWTTVDSDRILWDLHNNYNQTSNDNEITVDQIASFDFKATVKNLVNVDEVEFALFKRAEPDDDYWFILDKRKVGADTDLHMGGATFFDFYAGDKYTLKVKLYKTVPILDCSADIEGSDDYTAWGYNCSRLL